MFVYNSGTQIQKCKFTLTNAWLLLFIVVAGTGVYDVVVVLNAQASSMFQQTVPLRTVRTLRCKCFRVRKLTSCLVHFAPGVSYMRVEFRTFDDYMCRRKRGFRNDNSGTIFLFLFFASTEQVHRHFTNGETAWLHLSLSFCAVTFVCIVVWTADMSVYHIYLLWW